MGDSMKNGKVKDSFKTKHVISISILTAVLSFFMGQFVTNSINKNSYSKEIRDFINSYMEIKENYYDDIDDKETLKTGLEAIINSLDPYTSVIDDNLSNTLETRLEGEYRGIGVEIYNTVSGDIAVSAVLDESPASSAGIKVGDIITKMGDQELKDVSTTDFVTMVKKEQNNDITLTINRNGEILEVTLKRSSVSIPSIYKDIIIRNDKKIGYIYIDIFALNTYSQFIDAVNSLESENINSLIVDVRGNSGGHLQAAEDITSIFLDKTHVIYQIETKGETVKYYSTSSKGKDYPVAILVDENSASASEIFASAMKEEYKAILVGKKTYGKGTVQEVHYLGNDKIDYKITTKKWLTPKGNWIHKKGIEPDIEVELDLNSNVDTQLEAAINALLK